MAEGIPSHVAQVAALALADGRPAVLGVVGAGGSDAPAVLDAAAALLAQRGLGLARTAGRRLEVHDVLGALADLVDLPGDAGDPAVERKVRDLLLDRLASGPEALLVDDAQWLDPASLRVLVGVVERAADRGIPVVVTHRPAPGDPAIAALDAALARRQPVVALGPLDEAGVAERAALVLGAAVDQQLVESLSELTGGMPALVERLARSWVATGVVVGGQFALHDAAGPGAASGGGTVRQLHAAGPDDRAPDAASPPAGAGGSGRPSPADASGTAGAGRSGPIGAAPGSSARPGRATSGPGGDAGPGHAGGGRPSAAAVAARGAGTDPLLLGPAPIPPALVEDLRAQVDQLPPAARTALVALSAGADLDDELLRQVTGLADGELGGAVTDLRTAGLLTAGEDVVPVVAVAVLALTPEPDRRRFHARLADALVARNAPPMQAAEHLAAADARGPAAAQAYAGAGESLLGESPELARLWFDRAIDAGAPPLSVASRQAEAAALDGDTAAALRLADLAAAEPAAAERDRAQAVLAALLPARGLWRRAARTWSELATGAGPRAEAAALLAAVATVATGGPSPVRTPLAGPQSTTPASPDAPATTPRHTPGAAPPGEAPDTAAAPGVPGTATGTPGVAAAPGTAAGSPPTLGAPPPGSAVDDSGRATSASGSPAPAPADTPGPGRTAAASGAPGGGAGGSGVVDPRDVAWSEASRAAAAEAVAIVAAARDRLPVSAPLAVEALALTAEGLATTLGDGAAGAPAAFVEAAELLEAGHGRLVLPDTPHALGAVTALALCELPTAEHLLTRAIDRGAGGPAFAARHRLLLGWAHLRGGRWATAQSALDDVAGHALTPRDELLAATIEAGLARRAGDLVRLASAWGRAEPVLLRHPVDLFTLEVIGELAVAAARLNVGERIATKAHELDDLVRSLGSPSAWLLPLRWARLQVALAADDRDAAVLRATDIAATPPATPRLAALGAAAEAWVTVLGGTIDAARVQAAAADLAGLGLTWEASRLTGQAAIRAGDPSVTRSLLEQARDLKASLPAGDGSEMPSVASVLSEREQTVAQYVVDGLTHKEIGAQLYISPKTVEHHVAKIRQKLGASTRAEMMAALRTQLAS